MTRAHSLFRWFGLGWKVNADCPARRPSTRRPSSCARRTSRRAIPCGDDVDAVLEAAKAYADAGFTHLALVQIGGDQQFPFVEWTETSLLPGLAGRLRRLRRRPGRRCPVTRPTHRRRILPAMSEATVDVADLRRRRGGGGRRPRRRRPAARRHPAARPGAGRGDRRAGRRRRARPGRVHPRRGVPDPPLGGRPARAGRPAGRARHPRRQPRHPGVQPLQPAGQPGRGPPPRAPPPVPPAGGLAAAAGQPGGDLRPARRGAASTPRSSPASWPGHSSAPVVTAHPTEVRRRTISQVQRQITELVRRRDRAAAGEIDDAQWSAALWRAVLTLWQTALLRLSRLRLSDEIDEALRYYELSLFEVVPAINAELRRELAPAGRTPACCRGRCCCPARGSAATATATRSSPPTRFAAPPPARPRRRWTTTSPSSTRLRDELSMSDRLIAPDRRPYALAEAPATTRPFRADEPYRRALTGMSARLAATVHACSAGARAAPHAEPRPTTARRSCAPTSTSSTPPCAATAPVRSPTTGCCGCARRSRCSASTCAGLTCGRTRPFTRRCWPNCWRGPGVCDDYAGPRRGRTGRPAGPRADPAPPLVRPDAQLSDSPAASWTCSPPRPARSRCWARGRSRTT